MFYDGFKMYMQVATRAVSVLLTLSQTNLLIAQCELHEVATLAASDGENQDSFGGAVSISGDTIVIGAAFSDCPTGANCGAAYVYQFDGSEWIQQAKLNATDAAAGDLFGWSVSMNGDTIVVGAIEDDCAATSFCGAVYVFVKPEGGWTNMTQTAKLTASDIIIQNSAHRLGSSVSIEGDTIVASDPYNNCAEGGPNCGAVYVFVKPPGGWSDMTQTGKLTASDLASGRALGEGNGAAVSISGDTIVAGAPNTACGSGTHFCGTACVFVKPAGGWIDMTQTAILTPSNPENEGAFGFSASVSGNTIVVGYINLDFEGLLNRGAAYVYTKPEGGWVNMTETAKLTASDQSSIAFLGFWAHIAGNTIAAGTHGDSCAAGSACGSAYVFLKPAAGWRDMTESAKLTVSTAAAGDGFGEPAISGDTIVVGASESFNNRVDHGSAYVFEVPKDCNENGCPDAQDIAAGTSQDCNVDTVPDDCEITAGPGLDTNINGVLDECEIPPEEILADPLGDKIRFISFTIPASPSPAAVTALRVKLISMHHVNPPYSGGVSIPFTDFEFGADCQEAGGCIRWVGPPSEYVESSSDQIPLFAARLQCTPHYRDWSSLELLHVTGSAIVPSSAFEVENVSGVCFGTEDNCMGLSFPVSLSTRRWGDVAAPFSPPSPTVQPDVTDISALVDKFRSAPGAPIKARALLAGEPGNLFGEITPAVLSVDFSFSHISACVDAFRGVPYPYSISTCP